MMWLIVCVFSARPASASIVGAARVKRDLFQCSKLLERIEIVVLHHRHHALDPAGKPFVEKRQPLLVQCPGVPELHAASVIHLGGLDL